MGNPVGSVVGVVTAAGGDVVSRVAMVTPEGRVSLVTSRTGTYPRVCARKTSSFPGFRSESLPWLHWVGESRCRSSLGCALPAWLENLPRWPGRNHACTHAKSSPGPLFISLWLSWLERVNTYTCRRASTRERKIERKRDTHRERAYLKSQPLTFLPKSGITPCRHSRYSVGSFRKGLTPCT